MTEKVKSSLLATYKTIRPDTHCTHGLYIKLSEVIDTDSIHIISEDEQLSDVNSFFTICKEELGNNRPGIHPEVIEKFKTFINI